MDDDMSGQAPKDADANAVGPGAGAGDASGLATGDWAEVADALNTLGASIARATLAAVDNEENRRRLRELSEGLASLARRAGESVETVAATPEGERAKAVVVQAAESVREVGGQAAEQLRPHFISALQSANEKFRKAAEQWETPEKPAVEVVEPASAFADLAEPVSEPAAKAPAAPETPVAAAPSVPSRTFETGPVSTDKLDAVRIAHERFVAERKAAEAAAAAAKAAGDSDEVVRDESVIGPEPAAENADTGDRSMW